MVEMVEMVEMVVKLAKRIQMPLWRKNTKHNKKTR